MRFFKKWLGSTPTQASGLTTRPIVDLVPAFESRQVILPAKCGHDTTVSRGNLYAFGQALGREYAPEDFIQGIPKWCWKCLSQMAIQCAFCGDPIFPGDYLRVSRFATTEHRRVPRGVEMAYIFQDPDGNNYTHYFGCMRPLCAGHKPSTGRWIAASAGCKCLTPHGLIEGGLAALLQIVRNS